MPDYRCEECAQEFNQEFDLQYPVHYFNTGDEPCIGRILPKTNPIKPTKRKGAITWWLALWILWFTTTMIWLLTK